MFCSSDGSSTRANVPISASVAITPRTRSLPTASLSACPIGRQIMACQASSAPGSPPASTCLNASSRDFSGAVIVGHSREVTIRARR